MRTILMYSLFAIVGCEDVSGFLENELNGPSRVTLEDYCLQLDECAYLVDTTVTECTDELDAELTDMTALETAACETQLRGCLGREDCTAFVLCDTSLCTL
ncbi:MAG: hypothetical protein KTR31_29535 [Myxococcales bacterium]|nr:hypothetical protein [Myxococcales bacterium]